jgi:hypothetical protein
MSDCRPYVCDFPPPANHAAGDRWTCPGCGATYRLTSPKPWRWWRNWSAPFGHWVVTR